MGTFIGILIAIVSGVFLLILAAARDIRHQNQAKKAANDYYEINNEHINKGLDANTYDEARKHLTILEQAYPGDNVIYPAVSREVYREDMRDLRQWVKELKKEEKNKWEDATSCLLNDFRWNYWAARDVTLADADKIKKYTVRCMDAWDKYHSMVPSNNTIDPRDTFIKYMEEDYDPCMENREALEERLNFFIAEAEPLQQRKNNFYREVRHILREKGEMYRSSLLQTPFDGYTPEEVKVCYDCMVKTHRIMEEKRGNRYIVYLKSR